MICRASFPKDTICLEEKSTRFQRGNLLKTDDGLAYLDFGMVSEVPTQVREGLLIAVAYVVAGDYGKVRASPNRLVFLHEVC